MARWEHRLSLTSDFALQFYYDRTERRLITNDEVRDTLDLDFQYRFEALNKHNITWGLGYRLSAKDAKGTFTLTLDPLSRNSELFSGFIHDDVELIEDHLHMIIGSKFEHNDFSGFEYQPSLRFLWTPDKRNTIWTAASQAVQTPSEATSDLHLRPVMIPVSPPPPPFVLAPIVVSGTKDLDSQKVTSYEIGCRSELTTRLTVDIAAFYSEYDDIIDTDFLPNTTNSVFSNNFKAETYGGEILARFKVSDFWLISAGYTALQMQVHQDTIAANSIRDKGIERENPHHQIQLRSTHQLSHDVDFDIFAYFVDNIDVTRTLQPTQRCLFFYDKYAVIRGLRASTACLQGVLTSKESLSHRIN